MMAHIASLLPIIRIDFDDADNFDMPCTAHIKEADGAQKPTRLRLNRRDAIEAPACHWYVTLTRA